MKLNLVFVFVMIASVLLPGVCLGEKLEAVSPIELRGLYDKAGSKIPKPQAQKEAISKPSAKPVDHGPAKETLSSSRRLESVSSYELGRLYKAVPRSSEQSVSVRKETPADSGRKAWLSDIRQNGGSALLPFADEGHAKKHLVKAGETLESIARAYGISAADLRQWNDIGIDIDKHRRNRALNKGIRPGDSLYVERLPGKAYVTEASYYGHGDRFDGRIQADGTKFNKNKLSVAVRDLPLGSYVRVRNPENGRELDLQVRDRGPYIEGRGIDLSWGAACALGCKGTTDVIVTPLHKPTLNLENFDRERPEHRKHRKN